MKLVFRVLFLLSALHLGTGMGSALAESATVQEPSATKPADAKKPDEVKKPEDAKKAGDGKKPDVAKKAEEAEGPASAKKAADAKKPQVFKSQEIYQSSASFLGKKLAAGGYDTVAYHTQNKPVAGSDEFSHTWKGATWRFSSKENLELFVKEPEKYAPQYGGYCAFAVAHRGLSPGDPRHWRIVDGKLYLNLDASVQTKWNKDHLAFIKRGDQNWPNVLK